jgi:hypothetical protein
VKLIKRRRGSAERHQTDIEWNNGTSLIYVLLRIYTSFIL